VDARLAAAAEAAKAECPNEVAWDAEVLRFNAMSRELEARELEVQ